MSCKDFSSLKEKKKVPRRVKERGDDKTSSSYKTMSRNLIEILISECRRSMAKLQTLKDIAGKSGYHANFTVNRHIDTGRKVPHYLNINPAQFACL